MYYDELEKVIAQWKKLLQSSHFLQLKVASNSTVVEVPDFLQDKKDREKLLQNLLQASIQQKEVGSIVASSLGVFYQSVKPGDPPLAKEGDYVQQGQTIGLIGAMKVFSEIQAPISGVVKKIYVSNEELVKIGQEIMHIVPQ
jgi:biotin carboxyl carrier protein